ncbi:hypothetical protein PAPYR_11494 [Paratrimastix pyriformis]|uniref:Uncharacterized protein n=1 Tax=Paratrimastix pyriformis TaxID=342808 RepID=A0ABQ8U3L2_9EUKA|nr:hypothetical protein PAPYR_11494 [Paratrimastix pyriformis]
MFLMARVWCGARPKEMQRLESWANQRVPAVTDPSQRQIACQQEVTPSGLRGGWNGLKCDVLHTPAFLSDATTRLFKSTAAASRSKPKWRGGWHEVAACAHPIRYNDFRFYPAWPAVGHVCLVADSAANVALQTHLPTFANPALASLVDLCSFDHGGVPHEIENDTGLGLKIFQRLLTLPRGDWCVGTRDCIGPIAFTPAWPSAKSAICSPSTQLGCHRICYQCLVDASAMSLCCSPARPFSKEHVCASFVLFLSPMPNGLCSSLSWPTNPISGSRHAAGPKTLISASACPGWLLFSTEWGPRISRESRNGTSSILLALL